MIILGIDASSEAAAVGISSDGALLCEYTLSGGKNHSVRLVPMIEEALRAAELSFSDIDAFACGVGPGSFTGVRIGVATAKGFAQALEKPMVSLSSLEILAENIRDFEGLRVSVIFARADELFCAAYDKTGEVLAPCVMSINELTDYLGDKDCLLCGSGALRFADEILAKAKGAKIAEGMANTIRGGAASSLGEKAFLAGNTCTYEDMAPVYLRVSQAEREYAEKQGIKLL